MSEGKERKPHSAQKLAREKKKKRTARVERRRSDTRAEILEATRALVLRKGIEAFTLEQVARELGLTKQALYYYFTSKETLLFSLCMEEWTSVANKLHTSTSAASNAPDALDALIRSFVSHYAGRLEVFVLVTQRLQASALTQNISPESLAPIRPLNDLMYGPTEKKIAEEQKRGLVPASVHPRRLAFSAHVAAMGLLAMKAMVEQVGDPLKHTDEQLLDELCAAFRARCRSRAG